jgi:hypothetical protein
MIYRRIRLLALLLALVVTAAVSYAAITGSISGTVTDASSAVIPGVTVTVLNVDTGVKQAVVSDGRGFFSFPALDVGTYTVSISQPGFATYQEAGIKIDANSAVRADVQLKVGGTSEVVDVTANAVQIETQNSQLGEVIEDTKITAMPLNGRSFTDLLSLQPGVSPYSAKSETGFGPSSSVSGSLNAGNMSVNGGREASNGYMVNGGDVNDGVENGTAIVPNLDSIAEFRIITDNFSAEYGNFSGGQVNVVTKNGTDKFHGSAFEFLRNTNFNASDYFSQTQPAYKQNIYGGTFGGPIKRGKVFFFGDYQGTNATIAQTENIQTASADDLTGNVSDGEPLIVGPQDAEDATTPYLVGGAGWASVLTTRLSTATGQTVTAGEPYDYLAGTINPATVDPNTGIGVPYGSNCTNTTECVFPGAIIPQAAWDPVAKNLFTYIPKQTPGATIGGMPAFIDSAQAQTLTDKKESGRVDVNTRFGTFFAYYFLDNDTFTDPYAGGQNTDGQFPGTTTGRAQLYNLGLTTSFKNNSVNTFRFTYMRSAWHSILPAYPKGPSLSSLGFTTPWGPNGGISPIDPQYEGVPETYIEGVGMGTPDAIDGHYDNTFQWLDNYMKVVGTHTLQVGVNYHLDQINERNNDENNGDFSFQDANETGYGVADFLLGAAAQGFEQASDQYVDGRSYYFGAFVEDAWRARPSLTLNYGVRYEISTPWWDTSNKMEGIVPGEQSKIFPNSPLGWVFPGDAGVPRTFASVKHLKFAPRFGFAYTPNASGMFSKILGGPNMTSIRGGFGLFYTNFQQESGYEEAGDSPYGDYYSASLANMLSTPYINLGNQAMAAEPFPFNWPPKNVSVSNPFTGYNFANAEPISGSFTVDTHNTVPYMEEYNLGIQRQIGSATVFSINYVGSQGRHLSNSEESNPSNVALCLQLAAEGCGPKNETTTFALPGGGTQYSTDIMNIQAGAVAFGRNPIMMTEGTSNFNSLQTQIKHTTKSWDILLGYTYQRSMDNSSGLTDETYVYNPRASYGRSQFDVPQYFVGSYSVRLPFDHWMSNDWGKRIAGGWSVSGVTKLAVGTPINMRETDDHSLTNTNDDAPNYTVGNLFAGGVNGDRNPRHINPATGSSYPYFNTSLFSREAVGQFGSSHRRFFNGPGLNDTDLALHRNFHIYESHEAEFRAEAFNAFNHTQFSQPSGSITSSSFGLITGAASPRILQLAVKYDF